MWEKRQTLSRSRARAGGGGEATFTLLSSFFCDVMWPRTARLLTEGGGGGDCGDSGVT